MLRTHKVVTPRKEGDPRIRGPGLSASDASPAQAPCRMPPALQSMSSPFSVPASGSYPTFSPSLDSQMQVQRLRDSKTPSPLATPGLDRGRAGCKGYLPQQTPGCCPLPWWRASGGLLASAPILSACFSQTLLCGNSGTGTQKSQTV